MNNIIRFEYPFVPYCTLNSYRYFSPQEKHVTRICREYVLLFMLKNELYFTEDNRDIVLKKGEWYIQVPGLKQDVLVEGRKDRAIKLINNLLSELDQMNFSHREINTFIHILLMQRESSNKDVKVAAVDCNPEALEIFKKQLSYISHVKLFKFLLDDINNSNNAGKTFENYDLILTTSTHYSELHGILPALKEKIMQAAVSPGQQTVIDIATITNSADIGILCISKKFLNIIRNTLKSFQIDMKKVSYIFGNDRADIGPFIYSKNVLIIPPDGVIEKRYEDEIKSYRERGGTVIIKGNTNCSVNINM